MMPPKCRADKRNEWYSTAKPQMKDQSAANRNNNKRDLMLSGAGWCRYTVNAEITPD